MSLMFEVEKLKLEHLVAMAKEPHNMHMKKWFELGTAKQWAEFPHSFSGFVHGQLAVCVGLTPYWNGRAHIWSVFSKSAASHFVSVFRGMKRFLEASPYNRIEMDVPLDDPMVDSAMAWRRAELLGFKLEVPRAKYYRPNGGDAVLFAWIRGN